MDIQRFISHLPEMYENWGQDINQPKSEQFQQILKQVNGMTTAHVLQLLNFAVDCLENDEVYCEIGCFQGASTIGALFNHPEQLAYAVDDFSESDAFQENLDRLILNLEAFNLEEQVLFCHQNFEEFFLEIKTNQIPLNIGLYFYDAAHDYRSQLMSLMLAKPFLADRSLIVISNSGLDTPSQAIQDFITAQPECELLLDLSSSPFWMGTYVLSWNRDCKDNIPDAESSVVRFPAAIAAITDSYLEQQQKILDALHKEAIAFHQKKRLEEAEYTYKQYLLRQNDDAIAWANLGMLYYSKKQYQDAVEVLHKSLILNERRAETHYSLGQVLQEVGAIDASIQAYSTSVTLEPQNLDAYNNLGNLYLQTGQLQQAIHCYQQAIEINPKYYGSYLNLGNAFLANQQIDESIVAYETALKLKPFTADILYNMAIAFEAKGDQAEAALNLAHAFYRDEKYAKAIVEFQKFLSLRKGEAYVYNNLSDCYAKLDREEECLNTLKAGIELYPDKTYFYTRLVRTLMCCGQNEEALAIAQASSKLHPENLSLYLNHALMVPLFYETEAEIDTWRQHFAEGMRDLSQTLDLDSYEARQQALEAIGGHLNFYLCYQARNDLDLYSQYGQVLTRIMHSNYAKWSQPLTMPPLDSNGKIRIGYLSNHVAAHAGTRWALGWFKFINREKFEIYCYHTGTSIDATTQVFRLYFDQFRHCSGDLESACEAVLADRLHVLVFLDIGMHPITSQMAALRLAPVQCTTWGHPITSGIANIDYYLSGELVEPPDAQSHYLEKLILLPNIGISYPKPMISEASKQRADFGLEADDIVYLCCQHWCKYLPQHDYLLAEIAAKIPKAKFVFAAPEYKPVASMQKRLAARLDRAFQAVGLSAYDHCIFVERQKGYSDYLSILLNSDIFLDSVGFSGGHTTLEAIACNLPVVTLPSEFMRGRQSYGFLTLLGVTDTIAASEAEYIEIAVKLGLDLEWRQHISQRISDQHANLYYDQDCIVGLENFYQTVVQEYLSAQELQESHIHESGDSQPSQLPQQSGDRKIVLHVGCGVYNPANLHKTFHNHEEWQEIRFDINPEVKPDVIGSLTDMSAVADESVDAIWSSHNIEHLAYHEVPIALLEFYRVLKPTGFILITLPDLQKVAEYVTQGKLEEPLYGSYEGLISAIDILYGSSRDIASGNSYMAHRTGFTADTLRQKFEQAGFANIDIWKGDNLDLWAKVSK